MKERTYRNRLAASTSPYLLQHADNPVDWWPWCPEALELALRENKPILLSIGYSACHWCHVMAHESFEDPDTAAVMNRLFVNIKVDREERPDLDKIYQTAHQLLARRAGGWPLTVFLTPDDHKPFFAGTYFPPAPRHGMPSFTDLLQRVEQAYREQLPAIREQNQALMAALARLEPAPESAGAPDDAPIREAERQFEEAFDARHGGFGGAPKFPHPSSLEFLLRRWEATGDAETGHRVRFTLERMAAGGMNDQLGGGFCRYSVDERWMIPHFEKMLYDNGPLLAVYALAWAATDRHPVFAHVCRRTAEWALREMRSPDGGFYSSLDADSEGEEGLFYVWSRDEVRDALSEPEYAAFAPRFGLDREPNFEGRWHLHTYTDTPEIAERLGLEPREVRRLLASARDTLMARREQRVRPGRDEKILTSWNALMAGGLARAGRLLDEPTWVEAAGDALVFLRNTHWRDGRLLATSKDGQAHLSAYLDDHAFLIDALLEMLQARWDTAHLSWALELAEVLLAHFEDQAAGGFYFTADDHEALLQRPKGFADESVPAGNGVAASALLRLGHLVGDPRLLEAAERTLRAGREAAARLPYAHPSLLIALDEYLHPPAMLVVRGPAGSLPDWRSGAARQRWPNRLDFFIPDDAGDLPGVLAAGHEGGATRAYLCRGTACEAPIGDLAALTRRLAQT